MARVTPEEAVRIAALARLELSAAEAPVFAAQLEGVLAHMESLQALDPCEPRHDDNAEPELRNDIPGADELHGDIADIAPAFVEQLFTLPRLDAMSGAEDGA